MCKLYLKYMTVGHLKTISKVKKMWKTISQVYDSK